MRQGTEDQDNGFENMQQTNIGILGAQGHFGQSLAKRLDEIKPPEMRVTGTVDKNHNPEIASRSDLVIITVQPQHLTALAADIHQTLKPRAQILSFAVGVPMKSIRDITGRPVARAMADPWWNYMGYVKGLDFDECNYRWIFERLGKRNIIFDDEQRFDAFTPGITHLYTTLLYSKVHPDMDVAEHLKYLAWLFHSYPQELLATAPKGEPDELLKKMATKGGVTEAALHALNDNPRISPEELSEAITRRQEEIKKRVLS